ncbi:hypothetical protein ACFWIA_12070 [Streptomyces sp. NPDC127068]|uniref:hypothetical protein n=1 Tax=Streptomyces sp. NPDC127068 TaxID=3347127 RepID=UPI0036637DB3
MNHNAPLSAGTNHPRSTPDFRDARLRVMSLAQLRAHGVSAAETSARCRSGGSWQPFLPGVYLLHQGPPTSEERLHGVLLYAGRPSARGTVPAQPVAPEPHHAYEYGDGLPFSDGLPYEDEEQSPYRDAMLTGMAALRLYGFVHAPSLLALDRLDVLVPRTRRLRSTPQVRLVRAVVLPRPHHVTGLPVAPVPRALADAIAQLGDAPTIRALLTEAVRDRHCEPAAVVRELNQARLLGRPHVVDAVDSLLAEGRSVAEDRLYRLVSAHGLPEPVWNVDLRLPGGPHLGGVDAYWPEHAVAVELDTRSPRPGARHGDPAQEAEWAEYARKRDHLERLGITVVHLTPRKLRDSVEQQATVVRTALLTSAEREPATYVVVLPR